MEETNFINRGVNLFHDQWLVLTHS